jgi:hypothetical protein
LSQAFSSRYFPWTNAHSHHSSFTFQTAVLSVLCVMFLVYLSSAVICSIFSWYGFHIFPSPFCFYSSSSNYYWYNLTFQVPHSLYLYT